MDLLSRALVAGLAMGLSACGSQITSLRQAANGVTGVSGVPPAVTSLLILNSSPTRGTPMDLDWGLTVGTYTQFCLLENSTNVNTCVWRSGALPLQHLETAPEGPFTMTAYLRNSYGVSAAVVSNSVVIDRTPPVLASATVTNSNPTNSTAYALSYGAVSNLPYSDYCIRENDPDVSGCTWTAGALPASYTVTAVDGSKELSIWLRDAAGNVSLRVATAAVALDTGAPAVAFANPAAGTLLGSSGISSVTVTGTCSETGRNVVLSGAASAIVLCSGGAWTANLDFSAAADGTVTVFANHSDAAGNAAVQASRSFTKDTGAPTVAVSNPAAGTFVNLANQAAFSVDGTCSENTRNVVITGDASATVTCTAGAWSASLNFTAAAQGTVTILVNHADAAGNNAPQANRSFTKDTVIPTVAVANPAAGSIIGSGAVASFAVDGTCSENTRNVVISGDAAATVACTAGAWTANLNFTAAADGTVSIAVDHTDAAGNAAVQATRSFVKDTGLPTVDIDNPAALAYINSANVSAFAVDGSCSENTRNVVITGDAAATVVCTAGAWSANLNFSAAAQGTVTINVNHSDAGGNAATQATRNFTKDTVAPTLAISNPAAGSLIGSANVASYTVDGTCSENTRDVVITGDAAATVACTAGAWTANLNFTAAASGSVSIAVNHTDIAGNPATTQNRSFTKDVTAPTLAISNPAAGSTINSAAVASYTVDGTCSENTRDVVITGDATATVTCTAGAWTANLDFSGASDGSVSIAVNHSDAAGNAATTQNRSFIKDSGVPTVDIDNPAALAYINTGNVSSFAVDGSCSENTRNVVISGAASATVVCTAGAWTANLDFTAAAQGVVTINVDHSDAGGNNAVQASRSFTKDTVIPTVAISSPAAGSGIYTVNFATFAVSGTCSENTRNVVISGDAAATVACTAGAWNASLDFTSASDGPVTINVNHSDAAGNAATQASRTFNKDTGIPTLTIANPAANSAVNAGNVASFTVDGTCSENTQNVVISGDAAATVACTAGAWTANLNFTAAADGTVSIAVNHSDSLGNPAITQNRSFVKDVNPPTVAISTPAANSYINAANVASYTVTGTCSDNTRNVVISGAASATVVCTTGAWSANLDFSAAPQGNVTIDVNHSDAGGNAATQASRTFIKDTVVPTVAGVSPAPMTTMNATTMAAFAVSGTCSENTQNVVITGDASATVACAAGAWSVNLDFTAAAAGNVTIYVNHSDAAGNPAVQDSGTFVKDGTLPTVAISTPAANSYINAGNVSSYAVTGTCSENTRNVVISGAASATVTCTTGAWSANLDFTAAAQGNATINVDHTDAAGNSAVQAARTFIKDTILPTVTLTEPLDDPFYGGQSVNVIWSSSDTNIGTTPIQIHWSTDAFATVNTAILTAQGPSGTYAWTIPSLNTTTFQVRARATDLAGNTAIDTTPNMIVDSTVPTVAITSPAAYSYANQASAGGFTVSGTCSEAGRPVLVSTASGAITSSATCAGGNTWSTKLSFGAELTLAATPLYSDVVGYWKLNGTLGGIANSAAVPAVVGPNASASNVNGSGLAYAAGNLSQSISFDGVDDRVVIPGTHGYNFGTGPFTVAFWFNKTSAVGRGDLFTWKDLNTVDDFGIFMNGSNLTTYLPGVGDISGAAISAGDWHHVTLTRDNGGNWTIYVDGRVYLQANSSYDMSGWATVPIWIGANHDNAWAPSLPFAGSIDDVAIWNDHLTQADVVTLYAGQHAGDGPFTVLADHSDAAGNNAVQATRDFIKDTVIPVLAITSPAANSTVNAAGAPTFAVSGTCSDNGRTVSLTGAYTGSATCTAGSFTITSNVSGLAEGNFTINLNSTDVAGNAALQVSRTFVKDATAPALAISTPAALSYVNSGDVTAFAVTGTCGSNGENVVISGDASATVSCTAGAWSANLDFTAAAEGTVTINVNHSDAAGNPATQVSRNFTKDTTAPTLAYTTPAAGSYITSGNMAAFTFQGTCSENGQTVTLGAPIAGSATCTTGAFSITVDASGLAQGTHWFDIYLDDAAGNSVGAIQRNFVKDTVAPSLAITSPAANSWINRYNVAAYTVGGTCSAADSGRTITISGPVSATTTCGGAGTWSVAPDFTAAAEGNLTLLADMSDAAGTAATQASLALRKDTVNPVLTLTAPNGGETWYTGVAQTFTYTFTDAASGIDAGATVRFDMSYDGGSTATMLTASTANTGSWSWTPSTTSTQAMATVLGSDIAGNLGYDSSDAVFTIAAPVAPSIPLGLAATPSISQVALTWAASTGAPTPTYEVLRSTTSGGSYSVIASPSATSYTDTTVTNGTTYYYVVRATNIAGTSANSLEVDATPQLEGTLRYEFLTSSLTPTRGTQTISHSRADTDYYLRAFYTGWDGKLRVAPHNLFQRSQEFDNAYWTKTGVAAYGEEYVAPDGTLTADVLDEDSGSSVHSISRTAINVVAGEFYTLSIYAKAKSRTRMKIRLVNPGTGGYAETVCNFRTSVISNTATSGGFSNATGVATPVGKGWVRCSLTALGDGGTSFDAHFNMHNGTSDTYTGNTYDSAILWGAQFEMNLDAGAYVKTTSAAVNGGPRFNYNAASLQPRGILVEPSTTNLLIRSQSFDTVPWVKENTTVIEQDTLSPSGFAHGNRLVENTATGFHFVRQEITKAASSLAYTASLFVKAGTRNYLAFEICDGTGSNCGSSVFNMSTGALVSTTTWGSGFAVTHTTSEAAGNGWYRISLSITSNTATTLRLYAGLMNNSTTNNYLGEGAAYYAYIWGAQLEQRAAPTSFILTTTTTKNRAADLLVIPSVAGWYNTLTSTWLADADSVHQVSQGIIVAGANLPEIRLMNAPRIYTAITNQLVLASRNVAFAPWEAIRAFASFTSGMSLLSANGLAAVSSGSTYTMTGTAGVGIGMNNVGTNILNGHVAHAEYFPRTFDSTETATNSVIPVVRLFLVNARTNWPLFELKNGMKIDLTALPESDLNVMAMVTPFNSGGSVLFGLDSTPTYRTENVPPYALIGDTAGDYTSWAPGNSVRKITATAYSSTGGGGSVLGTTSVTVTFGGFDDRFDESSINAEWCKASTCTGTSPWLGAGVVPTSEANGKLHIDSSNIGTTTADGYVTANTYNFTGNYSQIEIVREVDAVAGCPLLDSGIAVDFAGGKTVRLSMRSVAGAARTVETTYNDGSTWNTSTGSGTAFATATHRYFRLRHDPAANAIQFETSADSLVWTARSTLGMAALGYPDLTTARLIIYQDGSCPGTSTPGATQYDQFSTNAKRN